MEAVRFYQRYTLIVAYAGIELDWISLFSYIIYSDNSKKANSGELSRLTDLITSVHVSPRMTYLLEPLESKTPLASRRTAIG